MQAALWASICTRVAYNEHWLIEGNGYRMPYGTKVSGA
jgi:hypothetical protein